MALSIQSGDPSCKNCILQDKKIVKISPEIGKEIINAGGSFTKSDYILINNRTLAHLLDDHGRTAIVTDVVPSLPSTLTNHDFVTVASAEEIQYFITIDNDNYKIPVKRYGVNRWIISSIYPIPKAKFLSFLSKPNGTNIYGRRKAVSQ